MKSLLSPRELAEAIGVSESSLKRWADDGKIYVSRTAGGHRRITIAEAIRFIREARTPVVQPAALGLDYASPLNADVLTEPDDAERLLTYLRNGRDREARGLIMSLYLAGRSVAEICDGPIHHAMAQLGTLWQNQDDGIFIEHRASDICMQALQELRLTFASEIDNAAVAVGGAPSNDAHSLPTLAVATVLASEGFRAVNLGADTPASALLAAVAEYDPRLVWLSASMGNEKLALNQYVRNIAEQLAPRNARLVVGGLARHSLSVHKDVYVVSTMSELVAFTKGLIMASANRTDPGDVEMK